MRGHKERGHSTGKRLPCSHYSVEPVVVHTPSEELMNIIHQQEVFMRRCRGNIMPTDSLLHLSNTNKKTHRENKMCTSANNGSDNLGWELIR